MTFLQKTAREKFDGVDENRFIRACRFIAYQLLTLICSALLASVNGLGVISPFGVAFAVSVGRKYMLSACIGAAAGYVMSQESLSALRYICAILCSAVLIRLVRQFERVKKFRLLEACTAFLMIFLTGVTVLFAGSVTLGSFFVFLGEACVGFASAYVFAAARDSISLFKLQNGFEKRDLTAVVACAFMILLSLSDVSVASVSFARIITAFSVLAIGVAEPETAVYCSVAAGLIFSADTAVGAAAFLYAGAGLAVWLVGNVGKVFKTVLFVITYGVLYAFFVASADKLYLLAEVLLAGVVVLAVPQRILRQAKARLLASREPLGTLGSRQSVLARLENAARAVSEISDCVAAASRVLGLENDGDSLLVYAQVRDGLCRECAHYSLCWTKSFSDCKSAFGKMEETLRNNEILRADKLPRFLAGCCVHKQELVEAFTYRYLERMLSHSMQRQVDSIRRTTSGQLEGLHALLCEMAVELDGPTCIDTPLADRIYNVLDDCFSIKAKSVSCSRDEADRLKIEIKLRQKPKKLNEAQLREQLEAAGGVSLSAADVAESENYVLITYLERAKYRVEAAVSRACAEDEDVCGDSYCGFYDGSGNYYAVLSDGMGTGLHAAVDSSLAVTVSEKLVKAGFPCEAAIKLVNSAMLLRSSDEALTTLDAVRINLYTGEASFFKAGACRSLVKKKSRIIEINTVSMPLGILNDIQTDSQSVRLGEGDLVLLGSDGAFEYSENAVRDAFSLSCRESAADVSQRVLAQARKAGQSKKSDDITVIAIRIHSAP